LEHGDQWLKINPQGTLAFLSSTATGNIEPHYLIGRNPGSDQKRTSPLEHFLAFAGTGVVRA
jgi:hypothetical protein